MSAGIAAPLGAGWNYAEFHTLMRQGGFAMVSAYPFSLHFAYYGVGAVPSVEDTIHSFIHSSPDGLLTTDAEIERMIGPVERTDLVGATVKGIGGYLRLVYKSEDFSSIPNPLGALLRRAARFPEARRQDALHQPQDRQGARHHRTAAAVRPRRR